MKNIIFSVIILVSLFACKQSSNTEKEKNTTIAISDIPKHWTQLTKNKDGAYDIFKPCNGETFQYTFKEKEGQWILNSLGLHDITEYPIINTEVNNEGDLIITVQLKHSEDNTEAKISIRKYSENMKMAVWEFPYEEVYETYTNELSIADYTHITQPCYECEKYCPEGNPNLYKTLTIPSDKKIKPGIRIGNLSYDTTPAEITTLFPKNSIIAHSLSPNKNEETHIRLSKDNELFIYWTEKPYKPQYITIRGAASDFKTKEGIGIGNTIQEVEKAFWTQFQIYGFEIDRYLAGTVLKWNNPEYQQLQLKFKTTHNLPIAKYEQIMGDQPISSSFHLLKEAGLVVEEITVFFNNHKLPIGEKLYSDSGLEIFDNKAYYKHQELYNGVKKLFTLIENEETKDCPVEYNYYYHPLSLMGNYYSYELAENGTIACGIPSASTKIKTIDITSNEEVAIEDVFTENSILNALKNDSWIVSKAQEYDVALETLNSVDALYNFIESMEIIMPKTSFAILDKDEKNKELLVRLVGFRQQPIDKVILGLSLKPKNEEDIQDLNFTIHTYDSFIFKKK